MEKTLMHTCCAPCSVACIHQLRSEGIEPVSYWFNPNIHPYQEYKARRDTLMAYAPTIGMELIVQKDYGLREFCRAVAEDIDHRCGHCYTVRLEQTARFAAENGFDSFTSTLFVSPYQQHERMARIAEEMARRYPEYEFERHKGYPTRRHYELLRKYGPCPIHRRTFLRKL